MLKVDPVERMTKAELDRWITSKRKAAVEEFNMASSNEINGNIMDGRSGDYYESRRTLNARNAWLDLIIDMHRIMSCPDAIHGIDGVMSWNWELGHKAAIEPVRKLAKAAVSHMWAYILILEECRISLDRRPSYDAIIGVRSMDVEYMTHKEKVATRLHSKLQTILDEIVRIAPPRMARGIFNKIFRGSPRTGDWHTDLLKGIGLERLSNTVEANMNEAIKKQERGEYISIAVGITIIFGLMVLALN
jgi:hypothetical protein